MTDGHHSASPPSPRNWRRGCRCHDCHVAEGCRRHRDLELIAKPIQVHGRKYTTAERLAIGTILGAPGGLATTQDIHQWLRRVINDAVAEATWTMHERLAMERARLEGGTPDCDTTS
jgi:hypothetical protein